MLSVNAVTEVKSIPIPIHVLGLPDTDSICLSGFVFIKFSFQMTLKVQILGKFQQLTVKIGALFKTCCHNSKMILFW